MPRRRLTGLTHARIEPDVRHQTLGRAEAVNVTDDRHERRRRDEAHPGNGHQATDPLTAERLRGELALDHADLAVQEVDLAQAALDGLALICGKLERRQPLSPCLAKDICHRRAALEVAR